MGRDAESLPADADGEPPALLRWSQLGEVVPLVVALVAAVVMYWPALGSGLFSDDFIYLSAAKSLSFGHFARLALVPNSEAAAATFHVEFWRPLSVLALGVERHAFGEHVAAYHAVNLGIHLATIVLVWGLGVRLSRRWEVGGIAALVFALHPAGFLSVAWISSVNSAALPLALAGWLCFLSATGEPDGRAHKGRIAISLALFGAALGFRETAVVVICGLGICFVLVQRRERWREWRAYLPLAPYAGLIVAYFLVRTRFLADQPVEPKGYRFGSESPSEAWFYLKLALFPFAHHGERWKDSVAAIGGAAVLAAIPVAVWLRKWLLAALLLSFVASVVPYSALVLGVDSRYFYMPSVFVALAVGVVGTAVIDGVKRLAPERVVLAVGAPVAAVAVVAGVAVGRARVDDWIAGDPTVQHAWVEQLRATYPTLPAGGTLYTVNTPLVLALFDSVLLAPTVNYYYPQVAHTLRIEPQDVAAVQNKLGPNDRVFVFDSAK